MFCINVYLVILKEHGEALSLKLSKYLEKAIFEKIIFCVFFFKFVFRFFFAKIAKKTPKTKIDLKTPRKPRKIN